ncbi:MAG: hypothetical protein IJE74_04325 [Clostridia bacterium]|nr:hypothetical protein [Clostridia bacterium]
MKQKRIIAAVLILSVLFSGFSLTGEVSELRRTLDGYTETVVRFFRSNFGIRSYSNYEELCVIPETENGYVPQGYCYNEKIKLHFISYYHDESASVIAVVDAESGKRLKTLILKQSNGKDFKGHAGGIAEDGEYFYLADGKKFYRLPLKSLVDAVDGGEIVLSERVVTDVKCSYLNSDGTYIYAGEFYTFTSGGSYDTDKSHYMAISLFETSYSRCNAYRISDISALFSAEGGETAVPEMIFTTPNCVQGFTRLSDSGFALSISYGRDNNSKLAFYEDVTAGKSDFSVDFNGKAVPAYHLDNNARTVQLRQPPLLEGIDDADGKVAGIFESGAKKYSDSAFIVNSICVFG